VYAHLNGLWVMVQLSFFSCNLVACMDHGPGCDSFCLFMHYCAPHGLCLQEQAHKVSILEHGQEVNISSLQACPWRDVGKRVFFLEAATISKCQTLR